jgi:YesN/AraC family two-component response regulator
MMIKGLLLAYFSSVLSVLGRRAPSSLEHYKISQCKQMVLTNLHERGLNVRQLAGWLRCAPDYLSHLFCRETGQRLNAYLNQQRIEHAKQLLATTTLNVSETGWASGYQDEGYFIRIFNRLTGQTHKEFR